MTANAAYWMSFARDILVALAIIVGALLAVTLYAKLRPRFMLRVLVEWVGHRLILRFEIENASPVYAVVKRAHVEVLERTLADGGWLSHWVDFSGHEDTEIFETTSRIYPGEVPAVERIYDYPADDAVLQIGFQVELEKRWKGVFPEHQQTTTRFVVKPPPDS